MKHLQLRIGTHFTQSAAELANNDICGSYPMNDTLPDVVVVTCSAPLDGRYVTMERTDPYAYFYFGEIQFIIKNWCSICISVTKKGWGWVNIDKKWQSLVLTPLHILVPIIQPMSLLEFLFFWSAL